MRLAQHASAEGFYRKKLLYFVWPEIPHILRSSCRTSSMQALRASAHERLIKVAAFSTGATSGVVDRPVLEARCSFDHLWFCLALRPDIAGRWISWDQCSALTKRVISSQANWIQGTTLHRLHKDISLLLEHAFVTGWFWTALCIAKFWSGKQCGKGKRI